VFCYSPEEANRGGVFNSCSALPSSYSQQRKISRPLIYIYVLRFRVYVL